MRVEGMGQGGIPAQDGVSSASQNSTKVKEAVGNKSVVEESKEMDEKKNVEDLKKELMSLTKELNNEMNPLNTNIEFGFSDDIKGLFVTVFEKDTQKVIRKIPSDEAMELMAKMREIVGMIFDKKG